MATIIKVVQDSNSESPRENENLGVMACWHERYNLGDIRPKDDSAEWLKANAPSGSVVLPLYLYDHGGITMRTSGFACSWDSGQVGYIVATPARIRAIFGVKRITAKLRKQVEVSLRAEVAEYDDYLTGNVWGYQIEQDIDCDACDKSHGSEVTDSCYGFIGDSALQQMQEMIPQELHAALAEGWEYRFN